MNPISHVEPPVTEPIVKHVASPHVDRVTEISPDAHRQHGQIVLTKHADKRHGDPNGQTENVQNKHASGKSVIRQIGEGLLLPAPKARKQLRDPSKTLMLMAVNEHSGSVANPMRVSMAMHAYQHFQEIAASGEETPSGSQDTPETGGEILSTNEELDETPDDRVESHENSDSLDMQA